MNAGLGVNVKLKEGDDFSYMFNQRERSRSTVATVRPGGRSF